MKQAKSGVTHTNAGLPYLRIRSAVTGGVVLEGREESVRKEEALAERFSMMRRRKMCLGL